ncbi:MAG: arsenate reductase ArsC [Candidatus Bathyarchaeia archaeon]
MLFICTDNSARSQMAEALLNSYYGDRYSAFSAGTSPRQVDPRAVRVMEEIGVDISKNRSKSLTEFIGSEFDYVVTVCDQVREACPFFPAKKVIHKGFEDPARLKGSEDEVLARFRLIRDQIKSWIEETFGGARRRVAGEGDG